MTHDLHALLRGRSHLAIPSACNAFPPDICNSLLSCPLQDFPQKQFTRGPFLPTPTKISSPTPFLETFYTMSLLHFFSLALLTSQCPYLFCVFPACIPTSRMKAPCRQRFLCLLYTVVSPEPRRVPGILISVEIKLPLKWWGFYPGLSSSHIPTSYRERISI